MNRVAILTGAIALASSVMAATAGAAVVSNFEPPTYTADQGISGVDGWVRWGGSGVVSPSPTTGYTAAYGAVISGQQSFVNSGAFSRPWGSAAASQIDTGSTVSWKMKTETDTTGGAQALYLSNNVAAGQTPAGVVLDNSTDTIKLSGPTEVDTHVPFTFGQVYLFEVVPDFNTDSFTAFVTNQTAGTPRIPLGSSPMYTQNGAIDQTAADWAANGGVFLNATAGSSAAYFDDIEVAAAAPVPEPAELGLACLIGLAGIRRRRRAQ